jgi:hypothetical protein
LLFISVSSFWNSTWLCSLPQSFSCGVEVLADVLQVTHGGGQEQVGLATALDQVAGHVHAVVEHVLRGRRFVVHVAAWLSTFLS